METSRAHILQMPKYFIVCRILQLVLAIVVLGLTIYGCIYVPFNAIILGIFTSVVTIIILTWILLATYPFPVAYNYWAILSLDIFLIIFWIVSLGLLANLAAEILKYTNTVSCNYFTGKCTTYYNGPVKTYGSVEAAAAALCAVEFVLFVVSIALTGMTINRHRKAGGHAMPLKGAAAAGPEGGYAVGGPTAYNPTHAGVQQPEKYEMNPGNGQMYASPPVEHQGPAPLQHNGPYEAVPQVQGAQQYQPGVGPQQ